MIGGLIIASVIILLVGLLVMKLVERMMYEQYKQSIPPEQINAAHSATKFYDKAVEKINEFLGKNIINQENVQKVNNFKTKIKRYVVYILTGKV